MIVVLMVLIMFEMVLGYFEFEFQLKVYVFRICKNFNYQIESGV